MLKANPTSLQLVRGFPLCTAGDCCLPANCEGLLAIYDAETKSDIFHFFGGQQQAGARAAGAGTRDTDTGIELQTTHRTHRFSQS